MKLKSIIWGSALLIASANVAAFGNNAHLEGFNQALNDITRPEADRKRDKGRKPAEVIKFSDIKPGSKVLDLVASGGYYTEVLSHWVGNKGEVLAHNTNFMLTVMDGRFKKEMESRLSNNRLANVKQFHKEFGELGLNNEVDAATLILNYHDMYNFPEEKRMDLLKEIKTALKPGGIFLVVDMQANKGKHNPKLHRIDSDIVKKEITSVGFKLAGESEVLKNPQDDHTLMVFDPAIRGKTDRFVFKFVK